MTDTMHVAGAEIELPAPSLKRLQEISAEAHAWELLVALQSAIADLPHWRRHAQQLLRAIAAGSLPEPPPR